MSMVRSAALAAGLSLALTGAALAGGYGGGGGGGGGDSGSGLNPNTQLTGNDRSAGVNGSYDPYLRYRLNQQGWNGYGRNGYWTRPVRTPPPPRLVPPFGGYPY